MSSFQRPFVQGLQGDGAKDFGKGEDRGARRGGGGKPYDGHLAKGDPLHISKHSLHDPAGRVAQQAIIVRAMGNEASKNNSSTASIVVDVLTADEHGALNLRTQEDFVAWTHAQIEPASANETSGRINSGWSTEYINKATQVHLAEQEFDGLLERWDARRSRLYEIQAECHTGIISEQSQGALQILLPKLDSGVLSRASEGNQTEIARIEGMITIAIEDHETQVANKKLSHTTGVLGATKFSLSQYITNSYNLSTETLFQLLTTPQKIFDSQTLDLVITKSTREHWAQTTSNIPTTMKISEILRRLSHMRGGQTVSFGNSILIDYFRPLTGTFTSPSQLFTQVDQKYQRVQTVLEKGSPYFMKLRLALMALPMDDPRFSATLSKYWTLDYTKVTQADYDELMASVTSIWQKEHQIQLQVNYPHTTKGSSLKERSIPVVQVCRAEGFRHSGRGGPPGTGRGGRGDGRGGGRGRGRGRGPGRGSYAPSASTALLSAPQTGGAGSSTQHIQCYLCGQYGHFQRDCPQQGQTARIAQAGQGDTAQNPTPQGKRPRQSFDIDNTDLTNAHQGMFTVEILKHTDTHWEARRVAAAEVRTAEHSAKRPRKTTHYAIVDSGAGANITYILGEDLREVKAVLKWGDERCTPVDRGSRISMDVGDLNLNVNTWYAPTAKNTLLSLRALLNAGATAYFTKEDRTITLPNGRTIALDEDFGFTFESDQAGGDTDVAVAALAQPGNGDGQQ